MAEPAGRSTPRSAPLVAGLAFVVLGGGALLIDAGLVTAGPLAVVAAALLLTGTTALVLLVAGRPRRPATGSPRG